MHITSIRLLDIALCDFAMNVIYCDAAKCRRNYLEKIEIAFRISQKSWPKESLFATISSWGPQHIAYDSREFIRLLCNHGFAFFSIFCCAQSKVVTGRSFSIVLAVCKRKFTPKDCISVCPGSNIPSFTTSVRAQGKSHRRPARKTCKWWTFHCVCYRARTPPICQPCTANSVWTTTKRCCHPFAMRCWRVWSPNSMHHNWSRNVNK